MKITKKQLKQIIKEEITQTLQEEERLDEGAGVMLMLAYYIGLLMLSAKTHEEKAAAIKQKIETTTDQEGVSFLRKVLDGMQSAATSLKGGDTSKWEEFTTDIDQAAAEEAAAKEREKEARRPDITMKDIEDLRKLEEIIKEELEKLHEEEKASACKQNDETQKDYDAGYAAGEKSKAGDKLPEGKSKCWQIGWKAAL